MSRAPDATQVICAVEDGWRGVRECSLAAATAGRGVTMLIEGPLDAEVLAMITVPPRMRLIAVDRRWFRFRLAWEILRAAAQGQLRWVVVTKARTARLLGPLAKVCGARALRLIETQDGYRFDGALPDHATDPLLHAAATGAAS